MTMLKPLTVWTTKNSAKFLNKWEYQTTLPSSWETCIQVKKQHELDMKQLTGSKLGKEKNKKKKPKKTKLGKEDVKAVYCHPAYLTSRQSTSCKMDGAQGGIKIARKNINNLRYADDTILMAESEEELKSLLMKMKEESDLKLNIQKTKILASGRITSWQIDGETMEMV